MLLPPRIAYSISQIKRSIITGIIMTYPIEEKLVIAVSSSALFDLTESNLVYENNGASEYKKFQEKNIGKILQKGVAFPFIRRFLRLNDRFSPDEPVEVILLSRNSAATGRRVFRSIQHYGLNISRAAFMEGKSPYKYIPAFNASLFLSANKKDVLRAIAAGHPAGVVLLSSGKDGEQDSEEELRIAFDFDGVIADDESEKVFKQKNLEGFHQHESDKSKIPHSPGPLADLFKKIASIQQKEQQLQSQDPKYTAIIRTAIITARNAPAHDRVITTLESWGVNANETFFLGGMAKNRILDVLKPHVFFDDQVGHLQSERSSIPMVHIPFGVTNK